MKKCVENVKLVKPLVHNITNYVTVNDVANMIIACGGSPIMADEIEEVEAITTITNALNINIGTLNSRTIESMLVAGKKANELNHPVVLDCVGAGASELRNVTINRLINNVNFDVIKGNISEIKAVVLNTNTTSGVDANDADQLTSDNLQEVIAMVKKAAQRFDAIIVVTGKYDIVADANQAYLVKNGHEMMAHITGSGCMLSGLIACFLAANLNNRLQAVASCLVTYGICGQLAASNLKASEGNATYRNYLIDAMSLFNEDVMMEMANYEVY